MLSLGRNRQSIAKDSLALIKRFARPGFCPVVFLKRGNSQKLFTNVEIPPKFGMVKADLLSSNFEY